MNPSRFFVHPACFPQDFLASTIGILDPAARAEKPSLPKVGKAFPKTTTP
jgi:hypothetical protein